MEGSLIDLRNNALLAIWDIPATKEPKMGYTKRDLPDGTCPDCGHEIEINELGEVCDRAECVAARKKPVRTASRKAPHNGLPVTELLSGFGD